MKRREHLTDELVKIATEYDASVAESPVTTLGASLAADLYLDNLGVEFPNVRRALGDTCGPGAGDDSACLLFCRGDPAIS